MGCKAEDAVDGGVVFHFLHQQVIGFYRHTEYKVGCGGKGPTQHPTNLPRSRHRALLLYFVLH